ncbi:MAG: hypothetical protein JWP02_3565 [Acidimicrobiales bacterium]|nr:hypothetical protein [Acidimicrobiales bacterium]
MDRRGALARILAVIGGFLAACSGNPGQPLVAQLNADDSAPLIDSHAEELAAFDRALGKAPCADCGTVNDLVLVPEVLEPPPFGVSFTSDGRYKAVPLRPTVREVTLCYSCATARELARSRYVVDYNDMPLGLIDVTSSRRIVGLWSGMTEQ